MQLQPVAGRTYNQLLRRLVRHYTGDPIGPGMPLTAVANKMLVSPRDYKITFLCRRHSFIVDHVILVDGDNNKVADANTYINTLWKYPHYEAMLLGGRLIGLIAQRQLTIQEFIDESGLQHTFARRVVKDVALATILRIDEHQENRRALNAFMEDYHRSTKPNSDDPRARIREGVTAIVSRSGREVYISDIRGVSPTKDDSRNFIRWITKLARKHKTDLMLSAQAYQHDAQISPQLRNWCAKMGFKARENNPGDGSGTDLIYHGAVSV